MNPLFFLTSASPRRHKILTALGVEFTVLLPDCVEIHDNTDAVRTVSVNALAKHRACAKANPEAWILAADTIVAFEGHCLGKPTSPEDARRMLLSFAGKQQNVFTAVAMSTPCHEADLRIVASSVSFRNYGLETVEAYLEKAKTLDRAGAYDIDTFGDTLIASHTGSYTNIMGLPSETVQDWLLANAYPLLKKEMTS